MKSSSIIVITALFLGIIFTGFQCSSTELTSAKLYIQQKNYDKALDVLKKDVEKNPQSDEGYFLMGGIYAEKGQFDKMVEDYNKSLAISPKFAKEITDRKIHYWANQYNAGAEFFKRITKNKDIDSVKVLLDKSGLALENAVMILPDSAGAYLNLAYVYLYQKEYDKAIKPLEKYAAGGKTPDGSTLLGKIYYDKGIIARDEFVKSKNQKDSITSIEYFNKAITILEQGRTRFPNDQELLITLSSSYVAANKLVVAIGVFKSLAENDPKKENLYNYGVVLMAADKYEDAVGQFNKVLGVDPNYKNAIYNLAVSYVKWGAMDKKIIEDKGEKSEVYKDKYRLAIPHLEKLTQLVPNEILYWDLLGKVYANTGNQDKAKDAFDRVDKIRKEKK